MALRVYSVHKTHIAIDGELVPIAVKRLTPEQSVAFNRDFQRFGRGEDLATAPAGETPEQAAARFKRLEDHEAESNAFAVRAIGEYVTVESGQLFLDDGQESITKGADLVRLFGAQPEVLLELLMIIYMENKLNADRKAAWRRSLAPFIATPSLVADRMMTMARVTDEDLVVDLGCGAGAICLAAARLGARAVGYDSDVARIRQAQDAAEAAGLTDRCTFVHRDIADVSLADPTPNVVAVYLLPGSNLKLKARLRALPKGTRIVSHAFTFGDWQPIASDTVPLGPDEKQEHVGQRTIHLYEAAGA